MRRLFARSELPVSVTSTMASASCGGLTSVAPQLNSTLAVTPCLREPAPREVRPTSVAIRLPCRSLTVWIGESFGHAQHPAHRPAADLAEDQLGRPRTTSASFSRIQS